MNISKDGAKIMEELQFLEQQLQGMLAQKQMFQVELQEVENALREIEKTKDEIYKILSGIMIRADKKELINELEDKKKLIGLRISSVEKQERMLDDGALKLREKLKSSFTSENK